MAKNNLGSVRLISNSLGKKGRIRGKSKKETKQLLAICPHHVYSKKGKLKPTIDYDNGTCTCYLCGATFSAAPYDNAEFNKKHDDMTEIIDQAKFMSVEIGGGAETNEFLSSYAAQHKKFKKVYGKIKDVAVKQSKIKKSKKKKSNSGGSSRYGSWSTR